MRGTQLFVVFCVIETLCYFFAAKIIPYLLGHRRKGRLLENVASIRLDDRDYGTNTVYCAAQHRERTNVCACMCLDACKV